MYVDMYGMRNGQAVWHMQRLCGDQRIGLKDVGSWGHYKDPASQCSVGLSREQRGDTPDLGLEAALNMTCRR